MGIHHGAGSAASTDVLREIGATYREIGVRDRRGSWTSTLEKGATSSGAGSAAPPIYPLCCQRCTHLTAELALTANRSPAARREAPSATASITRSRKSSEHGLGIAHPPSAMPQESLIQPGLRIPYDSTTPKPALDPQGPGGVLHAKAVVADDEAVFVTSANLTEAALDRNIELGVLIRDRALALTVGGYFQSLIDRDLLKPLPLA